MPDDRLGLHQITEFLNVPQQTQQDSRRSVH